jgi:Vacuolar protein sorting-associated protein 62
VHRLGISTSVLILAVGCTGAVDPAGGADATATSDGSESGDGDGDGDGDAGDGDGGDGDGDGDGGDGDGDGGDGDGDGDGDAGDGDGDGDPDPRLIALQTYAPRIWFPADESYWPSSVELAFSHLERFAHDEGNYWLRTPTPLDSPSDTLPFFEGDLATSPVYAFYADKGGGVVDLVYWIFYPYNRGKNIADTVWGNHVGDWEHVTVRLLDLEPSQIYVSAHSFGGAYAWDSGEVELFEGTHPIVYSAWGSHGLWSSPGEHVYQTIGEEVFDVCVTLFCADLIDVTSAGVAWDTWPVVIGFDFSASEGLGDASWPVWMSDTFTEPGAGDASIPGQGPIYRWGNPEDCSVLGIPFDITDVIGVCRLEDGPTGPISKSTWGQALE